MTTGERIRELRLEYKMTQDDLAKNIGVALQTVFKYEQGIITNIPLEKIEKMALIFNVGPGYIAGWEDHPLPSIPQPTNIVPIVRRKIPMLGNVAAGQLIYASEDHDEYIDDCEGKPADFALTVKGDSMSPFIQDGDVVFVSKQPDVTDGEIAVVLVNDEATLKVVYHLRGGLLLNSLNQSYPPMQYTVENSDSLIILGKAIKFQRNL